MEGSVMRILERALGGISPTREECVRLLRCGEGSLEAGYMRATAAQVLRSRNENSAIILGQIGVETDRCPGNCRFCTFGEGHTGFPRMRMGAEELERRMRDFCQAGDLYGLFLMTMHEFDLTHLLEMVRHARRVAPASTQIWTNIGDADGDTFRELKRAGVTGCYHVCRINEGVDTDLRPEDRLRTMRNIRDAGLELYTCCEPIGPEHTPEQIVENLFIGIELGCTQHAAMRRVAVPGTPLARYGQITELRLAQVVAVVALASFTTPTMMYMGVHEPNKIGYTAGANIITAESGANPRDRETDTARNRGLDMAACRRMLYDSGFTHLRRGDESMIDLNLAYLQGLEG